MPYTEREAPPRGVAAGCGSGSRPYLNRLAFPGRVPKQGSVAWPRWKETLRYGLELEEVRR